MVGAGEDKLPLAVMEDERTEHGERLERLQLEMEEVFTRKVEEKVIKF